MSVTLINYRIPG